MKVTKKDIKRILKEVSVLIYKEVSVSIYEDEHHLEFENEYTGEAICFDFDEDTGKLISMYYY